MRIGTALTATSGRRSSTGRTTSIRTCRRTTRSASTTSRSTSTATLELPDGTPGRHRRGPTWRRTPARRRTSAAAAASTTPTTRWSTTTGPACRWSRSSASPTSDRPRQARAYVAELRAVLVATGASDGRMEEGSMRVDANVSVRPVGSDAFGTRCEIKNLNSLRSLDPGDRVRGRPPGRPARSPATPSSRRPGTGTRRAGRTRSMRSKEEAYDYRYFPEPDLVPVVPDADWRDRVAGVDRAAPGGSSGPPGRPGRRLADGRPGGPDRCPWSTKGSTSLLSPRSGWRRRPRWPSPGRPTRWRPTSTPARSRPGCLCRPPRLGGRWPAVGHPGQGRPRRPAGRRRWRPGGDRPGEGVRGHVRRLARRRRPPGRRRQPGRVGAVPRRRRRRPQEARPGSSPGRS